jgi:hypothetical protein
MLNALNEVLRDDYIKDSQGRRRALEQGHREGRHPLPLTVPHKAFHRNIGRCPPASRCRPTARWSAKPNGTPGRRSGCPAPKTAPSSQPDGPRGRAGQVRQLDRPAGHGHQPPAGGLRVRALPCWGGLQALPRCHADGSRTLRPHGGYPGLCMSPHRRGSAMHGAAI